MRDVTNMSSYQPHSNNRRVGINYALCMQFTTDDMHSRKTCSSPNGMVVYAPITAISYIAVHIITYSMYADVEPCKVTSRGLHRGQYKMQCAPNTAQCKASMPCHWPSAATTYRYMRHTAELTAESIHRVEHISSGKMHVTGYSGPSKTVVISNLNMSKSITYQSYHIYYVL